MSYVVGGYWVSGYGIGDITINASTRLQFDVKSTSLKTKQEILDFAKVQIEAKQTELGITSAVYGDIYDPRDKSITRVFSTTANSAGFGVDTAFGGDITQITDITSQIDARVTTVSNNLTTLETSVDNSVATMNTSVNNAVTMITGALTPRLKVVNPFEALIIDTELTNNNGTYTFNFDSNTIGNGNYTLEVDFVGV